MSLYATKGIKRDFREQTLSSIHILFTLCADLSWAKHPKKLWGAAMERDQHIKREEDKENGMHAQFKNTLPFASVLLE